MLRAVLSRGMAVTVASGVWWSVSQQQTSASSPVLCEPAPAPSSSVPLRDNNFYIERDQNPDIAIISGTASKKLSELVCKELNRPLSNVDISQFSDGETSISIRESMRGKDVFIIQTCAPPVNDSVMELLLSIAAAKRSGATSVTAVIPYFGYRLNRRGLPISTTHHSRFLWNAAGDLAKMLLVVGADKVISVDLQRPGQGHEACFFKTQLPAETISTNDMFVTYFQNHLDGSAPVAVVSPNTEFVKKAKKFQRKLNSSRADLTVDYAAFLRSDADTSFMKGASLELQGDVKGKDVILIEDYIDSAVHITILCNRLMKEGARKVYICASHGLFVDSSLRLIDLSPVTQVIVSDSIALPKNSTSSKVVQLSIAPLLANVIRSDLKYAATTEFNPDVEEDQFVPE